MNITHKKRAKIVALRGHRSVTVLSEKALMNQWEPNVFSRQLNNSPQIFWGYFKSSGPASLVAMKVVMNSLKYLEIIKRKNVPFMQTDLVIFNDHVLCCVNLKIIKKLYTRKQCKYVKLTWKFFKLKPNWKFVVLVKETLDKIDWSIKVWMIENIIKCAIITKKTLKICVLI